MSLEDEVRREIWNVVASSPASLEAMVTGDQVATSGNQLLQDVVLPLLKAQGDAIVKLAAEIDKLNS